MVSSQKIWAFLLSPKGSYHFSFMSIGSAKNEPKYIQKLFSTYHAATVLHDVFNQAYIDNV